MALVLYFYISILMNVVRQCNQSGKGVRSLPRTTFALAFPEDPSLSPMLADDQRNQIRR
jgi:hypothetical protein